MHQLPLLMNIAVALVAAFFGGLIVRRIGLPSLIGYMLAGVAIGPFTPGFVGDIATISQLAELGVIFLMFGVGLHFSLRDLWKVRSVAVPGALGQTALATILGFGLSQLWGWSAGSGLVLGLAISVASTVVLLRGLMDNGLLDSPHGQAAVGWLIFEDLLTVLILVLMPSLVGTVNGFDWLGLGMTLLKAALFVLLLLFVGSKLIPWLLMRIVHTRSRELFILAILVISLGTALGAAELFGVSLALGAFVAGVVVSESPFSHQVGADLFPFRETFSVLFFVSIGMLANPVYLMHNIGPVLALTALIVLGKPLITLVLGMLFPWPGRTSLVVAAGLSQIGEFSFILGQAGLSLGLMDRDQYSLILAGALLSITVNPLMFRFVNPLERALSTIRPLWRMLDRHGPSPSPVDESISGHVVIVGYGRVGGHIVTVLGQAGISHLVVETDPEKREELNRRAIPGLFGDAANSEVLKHTGLVRAKALVVTVPDESAAEMIVASARQFAPDLPIIVRASTEKGVKRLAQLGAQYVIHPELEGGLEIVRHTLLQLGFPLREVYRYADAVRSDQYDLRVNTEKEHRLLHDLLSATGGIEISWLHLPPKHPLIGKTLAQADLRSRTGGSVVAIMRNGKVTANPKSMTVFEEEDRIGLIGDKDQIEAAERLLSASETLSDSEKEIRSDNS